MFLKKVIAMMVGIFIFQSFYFSQTYTQTIRGKVIDSDLKTPLIGANIVVLNLDTFIGTATNTEGNFRLYNIPVGRRALKVTYLGYEEVTLNNIIVGSGKEVVLQIELREKIITTEEVVVVAQHDKTKANNDLITLSGRSFRSEETDRYAGSRGDPSRMVSNYAGVASGNDARNDIIVRGNSPLGVLWRLEGIDIPNPNHFSSQGATGGPICMLNNNILGNSDFLTGAFPAEFGNKNAAAFDLKLRNGNNEKREYVAQIGINGFELGAEGPISKKGGASYLINYRYSTLEIFSALGIRFGVSAIPKYQDLSFKFFIPTSKSGIFTIWGVGGQSYIQLLDSKRDSTDWSFTSKGEDLIFSSKMGATGISHNYFFNNKLSGKLSLAFTGNEFKVTIDTLNSKLDKFRVYSNRSIDTQYHTNYTLTDKINSKHLIKAGVTYSVLGINYDSYYYSRTHKTYNTELNEKNNTSILQSFIHWQYRITEKLTLNSGIHYQNFLLNNSQAIEPRFGLKWYLQKNQSLSLGYGLHSQTQPLIYYFIKTYDAASNTYVQSNKNLNFTRSQHVVAAYDNNFGNNVRVKCEAYYQYSFHAPIESNKTSSFSTLNLGNELEGIPFIDSLKNNGTGRNYGIELTLEKFFSSHYYFLTTVSLYESKYTASDHIERYTAFSGGYVLNALGGYELALGKSKNKILAFDGKITMAGGNRYTPIDIPQSIANKKTIYVDSQAFTQKLRDYSRIDLKVSFKVNQKHVTQTWFINIENVMNRKNVLRQIYDTSKQQIMQEYQLGLFPYGGYRIEF